MEEKKVLDIVYAVNGFRNFVPDIQKVLNEELSVPCKLRIPEFDENGLVLSSVEGCDVLLVAALEVSKDLLEAAEVGGNLRLVFLETAGFDVVDFPAFKKHNEGRKEPLPLVYCPGNNARSVAEFTVMLILSSLRRFDSIVSDFATGRVENIKLGFPAGKSLHSQKVGLIGCGHIGSYVKDMLQKGFGCEIIIFEIDQPEEELKELLATCDIVSLHLPLNESTKGMISRAEFELMKPDSLLVNVSRGGIVEENDLYKALKDPSVGPGFYAADVFWREPFEGSDPMLRKFNALDNFVLTPHNSSNTDAVRRKAGHRLAQAIDKVFIQNSPESLVDRLA